eukprot:4407257-Prymnesium_polylepis.1
MKCPPAAQLSLNEEERNEETKTRDSVAIHIVVHVLLRDILHDSRPGLARPCDRLTEAGAHVEPVDI